MGFNVVPPATGTATLRVNGTLLNYGTKDIILTSGPGLYFNQVLQININSYLISGK
jgi:filamentous hemagglutinin family protein